MSKTKARGVQYAALPYRKSGGALEIMLITSRGTGRWVIPKGWPAAGLAPNESAAREALEESGLLGAVGTTAIGAYHYDKRLGDGSKLICRVEVFALAVAEEQSSWPEQDQRLRRWFSVPDAAAAVDEPELSVIIRNLTALLP